MSLSSIKITPLTIVTAICIFYAGIFIMEDKESAIASDHYMRALYTLILAIVLFITDIVFRRIVPNTKWIWLIQVSFIVLIAMMILIFKKI